jgi:hypothetical protein
MMLAQRHLVPIHAACVASGGAGLLLCGASGSGKSTLAFACARAGWTYVSDDCTSLLADSSDHVAIGRPQQVRFRADVQRHFPELAGFVARTHPNGKLSIEVPMSLFPEVRTAVRCPIAGLVFLDRESGGPARTEVFAASEAVDALLGDMPSYGAEVDAIHERTLGSLLDLPVWRLHYQSIEEALGLLGKIELMIPTR